ncbi:hypothetical protein P7C70_g7833, partial [Phenoliferia sp. Uapishka_3]
PTPAPIRNAAPFVSLPNGVTAAQAEEAAIQYWDLLNSEPRTRGTGYSEDLWKDISTRQSYLNVNHDFNALSSYVLNVDGTEMASYPTPCANWKLVASVASGIIDQLFVRDLTASLQPHFDLMALVFEHKILGAANSVPGIRTGRAMGTDVGPRTYVLAGELARTMVRKFCKYHTEKHRKQDDTRKKAFVARITGQPVKRTRTTQPKHNAVHDALRNARTSAAPVSRDASVDDAPDRHSEAARNGALPVSRVASVFDDPPRNLPERVREGLPPSPVKKGQSPKFVDTSAQYADEDDAHMYRSESDSPVKIDSLLTTETEVEDNVEDQVEDEELEVEEEELSVKQQELHANAAHFGVFQAPIAHCKPQYVVPMSIGAPRSPMRPVKVEPSAPLRVRPSPSKSRAFGLKEDAEDFVAKPKKKRPTVKQTKDAAKTANGKGKPRKKAMAADEPQESSDDGEGVDPDAENGDEDSGDDESMQEASRLPKVRVQGSRVVKAEVVSKVDKAAKVVKVRPTTLPLRPANSKLMLSFTQKPTAASFVPPFVAPKAGIKRRRTEETLTTSAATSASGPRKSVRNKGPADEGTGEFNQSYWEGVEADYPKVLQWCTRLGIDCDAELEKPAGQGLTTKPQIYEYLTTICAVQQREQGIQLNPIWDL